MDFEIGTIDEVDDGHGYDAGRMYRGMTWETDLVLWRNAQWAVTTYGIENVRGPYHYYISKMDLHPARHWVDHMSLKNWVDGQAFEECYEKAIEIHGGRR